MVTTTRPLARLGAVAAFGRLRGAIAAVGVMAVGHRYNARARLGFGAFVRDKRFVLTYKTI